MLTKRINLHHLVYFQAVHVKSVWLGPSFVAWITPVTRCLEVSRQHNSQGRRWEVNTRQSSSVCSGWNSQLTPSQTDTSALVIINTILKVILWWETYFSSSHYLLYLLIWMKLLSLPHSSCYQGGFRLHSRNCFAYSFLLTILLFIAQYFYHFLIDS